MKRSELFFSFLLLPLDILMIMASFILAYFIRSKVEIVPVIYLWPLGDYLKFVLTLIPIWIIIFALEGLYNIKNKRRGFDQFAGIFLGASAGIMLIVIWVFFSRTFFFSRLILIYSWILTIFLVTIGRVAIIFIQRYLYRYGIGIHRVSVIGQNKITEEILGEIQNSLKLGYRLQGVIKTDHDQSFSKNNLRGIKILGDLQNIEEIINDHPLDDILATGSLSEKEVYDLVDFCEDRKINFQMIPNIFELRPSKLNLNALAGLPILEYRRTPLDGWGRIIKRIVDIIGSLFGLTILSPLFLIVAAIIKLDSEGPIFFKQKRVGYDGLFTFYKFRTMKKDAHKLHEEYIKKYGNMFKLTDDPRLTRAGKFLRFSSIDELPQLWNVLIGKMSLIGPRPPMPEEVKLYNKTQRRRLGIKPGITGLWQVSGRSDLDFSEWVRLDVYYIENWSLWLDLQILIKTAWAVLNRKGAY